MFNYFLTFLLRMWRDQRGEVGEVIDPEAGADTGDDPAEDDPDQDADLVVSDDDLGDGDSDDDAKKKADAIKAGADETFGKQLTDLETRLSEREKHVQDLNKALHLVRKELKDTKQSKAGDSDVKFTDAQIVSLLEEHKDDPAGQLQIMKYVAERAAKGAKGEAIDEAGISSTKKELDGYLYKTYPDLENEGSEIRTNVDTVKSKLGLGDHPYGEFLSTASLLLLNLETVITDAKEKGKQEALKEKADANLKKDAKLKTLSGPGSGKHGDTAGIPSHVAQTAKQIGLNPAQAKIYAKLMSNKKQSVSVGD